MHPSLDTPGMAAFLSGKSDFTLSLLDHFLAEFEQLGAIRVEATKTMIGISNDHKRIAWITQLGKNFVHVVFPFNEPFADNFCFQKVAQVPGSSQFNHHFRMLHADDINDEVRGYMRKSLAL